MLALAAWAQTHARQGESASFGAVDSHESDEDQEGVIGFTPGDRDKDASPTYLSFK